jgi:hypothetical protein
MSKPKDSHSHHHPNRRDLLKRVAGVGLGAALGPLASGEPAKLGSLRRDLISSENEKPGTTEWLLTKTRVDPKTKYRCPWIEGYCSRTSVRAGDTLDIMVSTNPASKFVIDLYRLGYYGGKGGRHLVQLGPFRGQVQPDPKVGVERLRECCWEPSTTLTIPQDWPSGVYLGKLTAERGDLQSYVVFIVRDDRACDFLLQCSDATWQAYNRWPDYWSLYDDGRPGHPWNIGPEIRVSFDRPYAKYRQEEIWRAGEEHLSQGSGSFLLWEFPLAFWMEKAGYDVSYLSTVDTHADGQGLLRARGWISTGHDEYYSLEMFQNLLAARDHGVNLAFLSGDTCCGIIPFLPNSRQAPHRTITRTGYFTPFDKSEEVLRQCPEMKKFKPEQFGPCEDRLTGVRNPFIPWNGGADWTCVKEKHWLFQGTGLRNGEGIPGLVGFEWNGPPADIPGLEVVASGPITHPRNGGAYNAAIYPGPKGNYVFNASTVFWADALSAPPGYVRPTNYNPRLRGPDARVQRIMTNVFDRFRGQG